MAVFSLIRWATSDSAASPSVRISSPSAFKTSATSVTSSSLLLLLLPFPLALPVHTLPNMSATVASIAAAPVAVVAGARRASGSRRAFTAAIRPAARTATLAARRTGQVGAKPLALPAA
jgi:hypothetical protein